VITTFTVDVLNCETVPVRSSGLASSLPTSIFRTMDARGRLSRPSSPTLRPQHTLAPSQSRQSTFATACPRKIAWRDFSDPSFASILRTKVRPTHSHTTVYDRTRDRPTRPTTSLHPRTLLHPQWPTSRHRTSRSLWTPFPSRLSTAPRRTRARRNPAPTMRSAPCSTTPITSTSSTPC
jgi:hypothetical protein